jgi:tRNA(His) guanylyltransferase
MLKALLATPKYSLNYARRQHLRQFKFDIKKSFELNDVFMPRTFIVLRLDGNNFKQLTQYYEFYKPNDQSHVNLMNECALSIFKTFKKDVKMGFGFSDEFNLAFEETTNLYNRELK